MFKAYLHFIRNPQESQNTPQKDSLLKITGNYLLFVLSVLSVIAVLFLLISLWDTDFDRLRKSSIHPFGENTGTYLLLVLIFAPIVEELGFRLGLKLRKIFLSVSFSVQTVYLLLIVNAIDSLGFLGNFLLILGICPIMFLFITDNLMQCIRKNYRWFVYYNILLFGLIHIPNYNYISYTDYFYVPLLLLPQLLTASYFSYARLKYNILTTIYLHFLTNLMGSAHLLTLYILQFFE